MTISRAHMKNRSFLKYAGPPFIATVKEATITKDKTKQWVSRISNCHFWRVRKRGSVDRSVQWFVDQVRKGVPGPGVSVFASPLKTNPQIWELKRHRKVQMYQLNIDIRQANL